MNIDEIKKEYKKLRMPPMDISISEFNNLDEFVQKIKNQDKDDEKYLLHNKMIPVLIGIFFITIIMLINPVKTAPLLTGILLVFLGLFSTLILLFNDYRNISTESYDFSLLAYLQQKEERLQSWRSTPTKYQWTFAVFVTGLILMIVGNTGLIRTFSQEYILLFIAVYLIILLASWVIGEYFYRERHRRKHRPLLKTIVDLKEELSENKARK
jgi:uncharacterized membrane protein